MKVIFIILLLIAGSGGQNRLTPPLRSSKNNKNQSCINPNEHRGTCVELWNCQVLLHSDRKFIEASQCGGGYGRTPYVCCSSDTGFTSVQIFYDKTKVNPTTLPTPPTCGGEVIHTRIYGGSNADISEFPWMAFLEYARIDPRKEAVCVGSLINIRYVLTAGHCVQGEVVRQKGELIAAHFAVHDYSKVLPNSNRLNIVQKIVHRNLSGEKTPINDLALLRLERNILYTKAIRPICLPSVMRPYTLQPGTQLIVAGWGTTQYGSFNTIKQKVAVPVYNHTLCVQKFATLHVYLQPSQLCAGGEAGKDSCRGDSGAPLMHYRNGVWVLEGVLSYGRRCGVRDWPAIYSLVTAYTRWIMETLRP